jgi:hypothetical protein
MNRYSNMKLFPALLRLWLLLPLVLPGLSSAAHPLVSDDSGTVGVSVTEVEMTVDVARSESGGLLLSRRRTRVPTASTVSDTILLNATITRGLAESLDMSFSLPYERTKDEERTVQGINDVALELKWRIFSAQKFSVAIKPQLFPATGNERRDLGNGKTSFGLMAIAAHETRHFTVMGNLGYMRNRNTVGARDDLWSLSTGVLWKPLPRWQFAADFSVYRNPDLEENRNPRFVILGVIFSPSDKLDFDFGLRKGLNPSEVIRGAGVGLTARW